MKVIFLGVLGKSGNGYIECHFYKIRCSCFVGLIKYFFPTFVKMFKKSFSILFLSMACLLNLGHSFFPHTHVTEHHHDGKHHHHHEKNSNENGFSLLFSHFSHISDTFSNSPIQEVIKIVKEVSNPTVFFDTHSSYLSSISFYNKKELVRNKEPLIFISPHLHSLQFRGPPTILS